MSVRMMGKALGLVFAGAMVFAVGCGSSADGDEGDGGSGPGPNPGPVDQTIETECGAVATSCPSAPPHPGTPCEGSLACAYPEGETFYWDVSCVDGAWDRQPVCTEQLAGGVCGGIPPEAELCETPVMEGFNATSVKLGPPEGATFREFEQNELVDTKTGGQGSSMLEFRIQLDGEDLPSCTQATVTIASEAFFETGSMVRNVAMRCGETVGMYIVVPSGECDNSVESFPAELTVSVAGAGETTYPVQLPGNAVCSFF